MPNDKIVSIHNDADEALLRQTQQAAPGFRKMLDSNSILLAVRTLEKLGLPLTLAVMANVDFSEDDVTALCGMALQRVPISPEQKDALRDLIAYAEPTS